MTRTRSRVMTAPRGIGVGALDRRERVRGIAARIVDEIMRIGGDDANVKRIDLVTTYLVAVIDKAADGAIARMTSKLTDEERAELYRRMTAEVKL